MLLIAPGMYRETISITKPNIELRGGDPDATKTVIVFNKSAGTSGGTLHSATAEIRGDNFRAENLTIANDWNARMKIDARFPATHAEFLARCHQAGQSRPTPLLLQYGPGDYNCLHQDIYGDLVFPLQVTILLSEPGRDFSGGEFVITEQRPRMQSRAEVVPLRQGDGVIFAVHHRPVSGARGDYRVNLRHGVSRIRSGRRHTVGIIFHDAK